MPPFQKEYGPITVTCTAHQDSIRFLSTELSTEQLILLIRHILAGIVWCWPLVAADHDPHPESPPSPWPNTLFNAASIPSYGTPWQLGLRISSPAFFRFVSTSTEVNLPCQLVA